MDGYVQYPIPLELFVFKRCFLVPFYSVESVCWFNVLFTF